MIPLENLEEIQRRKNQGRTLCNSLHSFGRGGISRFIRDAKPLQPEAGGMHWDNPNENSNLQEPCSSYALIDDSPNIETLELSSIRMQSCSRKKNVCEILLITALNQSGTQSGFLLYHPQMDEEI